MKKLLIAGAVSVFAISAAQAQDLEVLQEALGNFDVTASVTTDDLSQLGTDDSLSNLAVNAGNLISASDVAVGALALAAPTTKIKQVATAPNRITDAVINASDTILQNGALSDISNTAAGALNSINLGD
ncbi:MAG: hypothetical protein AAFP99_05885 [Pseudomonadota bacterium]